MGKDRSADRRERMRVVGVERNAQWQKKSYSEQIDALLGRRGDSKKQVRKIRKKMTLKQMKANEIEV
jgi:hypothetical protein